MIPASTISLNPVHENTHHDNVLKIAAMDELSKREKKQLRKERFYAHGNDPMLNTFDALERLKEEKEKKLLRAQKFGIQTVDTEKEK